MKLKTIILILAVLVFVAFVSNSFAVPEQLSLTALASPTSTHPSRPSGSPRRRMSMIRALWLFVFVFNLLLVGCQTPSREQRMKDEGYQVDPAAFRANYHKMTGDTLP